MNSFSNQPYNEHELLVSIKSGSSVAFKELYERFSPNLLDTIFHIVCDEELAKDLLQDSFVKVWLNIHRYDSSKAGLYTWMLTITRNTTFRYLSCKHINLSLDELSPEMLGTTIPKYQAIGVMDWVESTLKDNELRVVNLVYFQGYTFQEISNEFGLPLGSVKTYVRRALQRLRDNT